MVSKTAIAIGVLILAGTGLAAAATLATVSSTSSANASTSTGTAPCSSAYPWSPGGAVTRVAERLFGPCSGGPGGEHPFAFVVNGSSVVGRSVSFTATSDGLANLTSVGPWANAPILASVDVAGLSGTPSAKGPVWGLQGNGESLLVTDGPGAGFAVLASNGTTATFVAASGVSVAKATDGSNAVVLSENGHTARLVGNGNVTFAVHGSTITAELHGKSGVAFHIDGYGPRFGGPHRGGFRFGGRFGFRGGR
jgi:hypothetical protein